MKYEVLRTASCKRGRRFVEGATVEIDPEYAEHLIQRSIVRILKVSKKETATRSKIETPEG